MLKQNFNPHPGSFRFKSLLPVVLAVAVPLSPGMLWAQGAGSGIEEIVVTAQKREESLQDTPIAVTAFQQQGLDDRGITDITFLASQVPSLTVQSNAGVIFINMRGAGNEINSLGADNGVGFHIDGVYIGNAVGTLVEMWDVERVEVLRGPQSTLYGRNTTGGSVNIISARPKDEFEAFGDFTYGNYDRVRLRGVVNVPLSDRVGLRLAGTKEDRDGFLKTLQPGIKDMDDRDSWYLRGSLDIDLSDNVELLLTVVGNENDDASVAAERIGPSYQNTGIPPFAALNFGLRPGTNPYTALTSPKPADPRETNVTFDNLSNNETYGGSAVFNWSLDGVTVRSITSYYDIVRRTHTDFDGSEIGYLTVVGSDEAEQVSQELQLISDGWERWDWIVGLYYFTQDATRTTNIGPSFFDIFGGFSAGGDLETDSFAVFGQATYKLSDQLSLTGGARFTWDEKEGVDLFFIQAPRAPFGRALTGGNPKESWSEPTGKVTLEWTVNDNSMLYASYAHGYRSGAINVTAPLDLPVDPEFVDAWEAGSKNQLFDDRLQLNLAFHYTQYDDQQFTRFLPAGNQIIEAAGESTAIGIEADFIALPSDVFRIDGSIGWIDAEFDQFETSYGPTFGPILGFPPPVSIDLEGNKLPRTPEWSVALGAQLTARLPYGELIFRTDFSYRSEIYYDVFNTDVGSEDDFTRTDARVIFRSGTDKGWTVEAYIQNIENDDVTTNRVINADVPMGFYAPPRTYGVRLGYRM